MKIDPNRLRQAREARAWSQEQLPEIPGISVCTVQRIENGARASLETRMALAAALELAPEALLMNEAEAAQAPEVSATTSRRDDLSKPKPPAEEHSDKAFRITLLLLLTILIVLIITVFGYQIGRDLAHKKNRADCVAAGRMDC